MHGRSLSERRRESNRAQLQLAGERVILDAVLFVDQPDSRKFIWFRIVR